MWEAVPEPDEHNWPYDSPLYETELELNMPSLYQLHVEKWSNCTKCPLHKTRANVVLARGQLPCDILLTGEAPGASENVLGEPFVGPAGHVLDTIIADALEMAVRSQLRTAYTNLVCCIPLDESNEKTSEPESAEITACSDRLREFVDIVKPKLIVAVGQLARNWLPRLLSDQQLKTVKLIDIIHPAAILRQPLIQQSFELRRASVAIAAAIREL